VADGESRGWFEESGGLRWGCFEMSDVVVVGMEWIE